MYTSSTAGTATAAMPARWRTLAPARKNIVNAVSASTVDVPRSGSRSTSTTTGTAMTRNGSVPPRRPWTAVPRLAIQWARYTTSASFMSSAGWTAGSGPILSQRAEPPTSMLIAGMNTSRRPMTPAMNRGTDATRSQR